MHKNNDKLHLFNFIVLIFLQLNIAYYYFIPKALPEIIFHSVRNSHLICKF